MATTWRRVGQQSFRRRMALIAAGGAPFSFFLLSAVELSIDVLTMPLIARIAVGVACGVALELVVIGIAALFFPGLLVSDDASAVRIGRAALPSEELDRFQLDASTGRKVLSIRIGQHGGAVTRLFLRGPSGSVLNDDERTVLLRALERSAVRPPRSTYDPQGRFARYNFPGALIKAEAIDLVRHADNPDYRLPLSS